MQASKENGVQYFIHTSSPSVVFSGKAIRDGKEDMPYISSRISPYSYTKSIAEKKVLSSNRRDFATVALRPHLIWGENDPHLLPMGKRCGSFSPQIKCGRRATVAKSLRLDERTFFSAIDLVYE